MVGTISPLVKGSKRQWLMSTTILVSASTVSAGALGAFLALITDPVVSSWSLNRVETILGLSAIGATAVEALVPARILPCIRGSVPQKWWIKFGPNVGALMYGAVLGTGLTTVIPFAAFYWVALAVALLGPTDGALVGSAYGLGRALSVPLASLVIELGVNPRTIGRAIVSWRGPAKTTCAITCLLAAVAILSLGKS